jgi:hypothetical protein
MVIRESARSGLSRYCVARQGFEFPMKEYVAANVQEKAEGRRSEEDKWHRPCSIWVSESVGYQVMWQNSVVHESVYWR